MVTKDHETGGHVRALAGTETTLPADRTEVKPASATALSIRWVFPEYDAEPTPLSERRVLLGRGEDCDKQLPGRETSRHHAEIVRQGPIVAVRDLGSTNGIHTNGARIEDGPLAAGDLLRLGEWIGLVVEATGEPQAARSPAFRTVGKRFFAGPALAPCLELAERVATSDLPVIVEGETGTGKEHLARAIHDWSGREGPLVALNCAAIPEALAEAELFGYARGAFTGAVRSSEGHLRAADGGTLLLDEVSELPLGAQAKLLRALELGEVMPLGETQPASTSARVIAATQQPLGDAVREGRFRADLLARLDGVTISLPPLRDRIPELGYLLDRLLAHHAGGAAMAPPVDARLVEALCLHDWPYNVRELDLLVRRLLALHGHERRLERAHLPASLLKGPPPSADEEEAVLAAAASAAQRTKGAGFKAKDPERDAEQLAQLLEALRRQRGNVSKAAAEVGLSRQRAYRLMEAAGDVDLDKLRAPSLDGDGATGGIP
ncbi:MAG: sigma 54-interacting transcriptional regulator [Deltaproteobacteria bacterium]|jgi:DNA-binding NtrC family response regulator|nr:sigma 54-interacting transcriptional regulator [Deltaproteobacteria bacterium]MBW2535273.1 sigma 54-interacting transcriptional regulator [Deltaproteobacteria bacterium]